MHRAGPGCRGGVFRLPRGPAAHALRGIGPRTRRRPPLKRLILMAIVVVVSWTEAASFVVPRRPHASAVETTATAAHISSPSVARPRIEAKPVAFTAQPSVTRAPNRTGGRRVALVIGIDSAPGADPLRGSKTDAFTMRKALMGYGFRVEDITMLLDAEATRGRVLQAFDDLAARSSEDGIAVVAITTHSSVGRNGFSFRLWDGRIGAHLLARKLGIVRGRLWTMLVKIGRASWRERV
jgi:hypothetical protein